MLQLCYFAERECIVLACSGGVLYIFVKPLLSLCKKSIMFTENSG